MPPLGFQEIAKSLTAGESPGMEDHSPWSVASHKLPMEPTLATVISTTMCQDQTVGTIYLSTVTTSMGLMNLEAPSVAVDYGGADHRRINRGRSSRGLPLINSSIMTF